MGSMPYYIEERSVWQGGETYGRMVKLRLVWARTLPGVWTVLHSEEVPSWQSS